MFNQRYDAVSSAGLVSPAPEMKPREPDLGCQPMMDPRKILPVPHPQADCMMCWLRSHPDAKGSPVDGLCLAHMAVMYGVDLSEDDLNETDDHCNAPHRRCVQRHRRRRRIGVGCEGSS